MKRDVYGKFYSPVKCLSYGRRLIFSVGSRSIGKSTGWAIHLLREYLEKGRQWIYVRRTQDETDLTAPHYFDNAAQILRQYGYEIGELTYAGGEYAINGEPCGYAIPLSLQQKYKSGNYSKVWYIIYDEFMIAPGSAARYLGGRQKSSAEVDAMAGLYQTVDRGIGEAFRDEVTVISIGNAGSFFNPFFVHYGIDRLLRPDTKYLAPKGEKYVVELTSENEATEGIKGSLGYYMSTERGKAYAYENKYADLDGGEFLSRDPEGRRLPVCNLIYEGNKYGVYAYTREGFIYVCHKYADGRQDIALTTADHRPNYLLIGRWHGHPITAELKRMYDLGSIRFQDAKCKLALDFYFKYDII